MENKQTSRSAYNGLEDAFGISSHAGFVYKGNPNNRTSYAW
eukprot:CAMPEP_0197070076 /NCGR_PEP_ID=MMETSP1384-20130603/197439_1 /TAXON_ID=29189 /ORGANISM="Ammonia sp." /LENGTH=40 /DNA_ID= /DNA_START= /DNA_END= /DNA_ORIENTATION=